MSHTSFQVRLLFFRAPLHVSSFGGADLTYPEQLVHSDTLMGALATALVSVGRLQTPESLKRFMDLVKVSSAFPCLLDESDGRTWYFFPAPLGFMLSRDMRLRKKVKKVQWLEKELFERVLQAERLHEALRVYEPAESLDERPTEDVIAVAGTFAWSSRCGLNESPQQYVVRQERMRVQVPRSAAEDAQPFYQSSYCFLRRGKRRAGLFFLIDAAEQAYLEKIDLALNVLADQGLGADRHIGLGHFTWQSSEELAFQLPINANGLLSLGVLLPEKQEQLSACPPVAYSLIPRGGWVSVPTFLNIRRNTVYMFGEGSTFQLRDHTVIQGCVRDLRPARLSSMPPIMRSGRTVLLPCKIDEMT